MPSCAACGSQFSPDWFVRDLGLIAKVEIFFILVTFGILAVLAVLAAYIMHFHPFLQQTWFFGIATCILFGYLVGIVSCLIERVLPLIERVLRVKE